MIIEAIFSTLNREGSPNFAPMGVVWGEERVTVRPFRQTQTYENLVASGYGVVSLTDNVRAFVQCGLYHVVLPHFTASQVPGVVYQEACAWRELQVISQAGDEQRAEVHCRVVEKGRRRDRFLPGAQRRAGGGHPGDPPEFVRCGLDRRHAGSLRNHRRKNRRRERKTGISGNPGLYQEMIACV